MSSYGIGYKAKDRCRPFWRPFIRPPRFWERLFKWRLHRGTIHD